MAARTISPVRGDFGEKGPLTTARGRAAGRRCHTAWERKGALLPGCGRP